MLRNNYRNVLPRSLAVIIVGSNNELTNKKMLGFTQELVNEELANLSAAGQ